MKTFLYWLTGKLPCRIIYASGNPYLERYYVGTLLGLRFYIHRFVGNEKDEGLHDHPWEWARSIVLSGWYYEVTRYGKSKVRWANRMSGDRFHRVVLPTRDVFVETEYEIGPLVNVAEWVECDSPCWTLFWHKVGCVKPWGFLTPIDGGPGMLWAPHNYPQDGQGDPNAWWETAQRGKDAALRAPKHGFVKAPVPGAVAAD